MDYMVHYKSDCKESRWGFFTCQKNIKRILGFNIAIQNSKQVKILCTLIQNNINRCQRHII